RGELHHRSDHLGRRRHDQPPRRHSPVEIGLTVDGIEDRTMSPESRVDRLDLTSRRFKAKPYPQYARLRADSPVRRTRLPDGRDAWLVTRYEDVAVALKDPRFAKDRRRVEAQRRAAWFERLLEPMVKPLSVNMLDLDGA